jgi:hypothetical protein
MSEANTPNLIVAVVEHFDARRIGTGRWIARCPAHPDRTPSLSIAEGRGGRVLVRCWAGCDLAAVLKAAGLTMHHLFPSGPRPTRAQLDAAARGREVRRLLANRERQANREMRERARKLTAIANGLGAKLARTANDAAVGNELARLFHIACDRLHEAEFAVESKSPPTKEPQERFA